jgi:hypothetical protein
MSKDKSGYMHSSSDKALDEAARSKKEVAEAGAQAKHHHPVDVEDAVTESNMHVKRKD